MRGEYLYTANGPGGLEVFDVANIDQKGFSERIVSAPVSPLGQRTRVNTKFATSVALPSTLALDPARERLPENEEQPIDMFYAFVYVSDREEGLVGSNVATLVDGNPDNNFLKRDVTFNPDGVLTGASFVTAAGHRLYLTTPRGLFVIDCTDPMNPRLAGQFTGNFLRNPHCVAIQFRYAFVTDDDGLKVLNITDPDRPMPVSGGVVRLHNPVRLYVARTYAYVANGPDVRRRRSAQRYACSAGRERERLAVRPRRRWTKWPARGATYLTGYSGRGPGIQPAAEPAVDRDLSDARRGDRCFSRPRARSGGGRNWRADGGLRPAWLPALSPERNGAVLSSF